jgi:hypothetical protein
MRTCRRAPAVSTARPFSCHSLAATALPPPPIAHRRRRYVRCELYERAAGFFGRAAELQPGDVKWRLMVASCHRRAGALGAALEVYAGIHAEHPDNLECESSRRRLRVR